MNENLLAAGERIKDIMDSKGLSIRELAKRAGYSHSYIYYIIKGEKRGSIEVFVKIADVLGVPVGDLLEEKIDVPDELKKEGVEWIIFGRDLEKEGISMEQVKKWVEKYKKDQ